VDGRVRAAIHEEKREQATRVASQYVEALRKPSRTSSASTAIARQINTRSCARYGTESLAERRKRSKTI
jgi:hypothetical protein